MAAGILGFSILVALVTQTAGIFNYWNVLAFYFVGAVIALTTFWRQRLWTRIRFSRTTLTASLFVVIAFTIVWAEFYVVHYHYSGPVATQYGTQIVASNGYPYPFYSDEWITAGMAQFSINQHVLPAVNPLNGKPFPDLVLPFHALTADFFLLFGLSPVNDFATMAIIGGLITAALLYVLCRSLSLGRVGSLVAVLCLPFITNSGNLPGPWFFLAYSVGTWGLLIALAAAARNDKILTLLASFLALALYPQLVVFIVPLLIAVALRSGINKDFLKIVCVSGVVILLAAGSIITLLLVKGLGHGLITTITADILYRGSDGGSVALYPWDILPMFVLTLATIGFYPLFQRRRWAFVAVLTVGIAYWIYYSLTPWIFIIEYFRLVSVMAILLTVVAGAGADFLINTFRHWFREEFWAALLVITCSFTAFFYPNQQNWQELVLTIGSGGTTHALTPSAPISRFLTADDLALFHNITGARFIAPPWKGLVIGITTGNIPLQSKAAYITVNTLSYNNFMQANCSQKETIASQYGIAYAYASGFSCGAFTALGTSTENLILYRFIPNKLN